MKDNNLQQTDFKFTSKFTNQKDQFVDNKNQPLDGHNIQLFTGYGYYIGDFKNGKMHGKGKYNAIDGSKYEGKFVNNKIHDLGIFTSKNGKSYVGYFENGTFSNTKRYSCIDESGKTSIFTTKNKNYDLLFNGKNNFNDYSCYNGEFNENKKFEGYGELFLLNGNKFEGKFKNGKPSKGIYKYVDGSKYEGLFDENGYFLHGIYIWPNGKIYEGGFNKKKEFEGEKCSLLLPSGDLYKGGFKNNKFNGYGIYKKANGKKFAGYFQNGKIINNIKQNNSNNKIENDNSLNEFNNLNKAIENFIQSPEEEKINSQQISNNLNIKNNKIFYK